MSGMLQNLPFDALVRLSSFLSATELAQTYSTCKALRLYFFNIQVWSDLLNSQSCVQLNQSIGCHLRFGRPDLRTFSPAQYIEIARQCSGMQSLHSIQWMKPGYASHTTSTGEETNIDRTLRLPRMEAHTMTTVLNRYLVVICGWGSGNGENEIIVLDGWALPTKLLIIPSITNHSPRFRYGFTTCLFNNSLLVFGGCRDGGYSGDCNDFYRVTLTFHHTIDEETYNNTGIVLNDDTACMIMSVPLGYWRRVTAEYSSNLVPPAPRFAPGADRPTVPNGPYRPMTRGYHSAFIVRFNHREAMLVYGGLHRRSPSDSLEICYLDTLEWLPQSALTITGTEPSPRMGHSANVMVGQDEKKQEVLFIGGSDGNDLWRNGRDYKEVFLLQIITDNDGTASAAAAAAAATASASRLHWQKMELSASTASRLVPGRCHSAAVVHNNRVLCFGGGSEISNRLISVQYESNANNQAREVTSEVTLVRPIINQRGPHQNIPANRSSVAACMLGRFYCLYGGWSHDKREMGDFWVLDLASGAPAAAREVAVENDNQLTRDLLVLEEKDWRAVVEGSQADIQENDCILNQGDGDDDEEEEDEQATGGGGGGHLMMGGGALQQVFQLMLTQGMDFMQAAQLQGLLGVGIDEDDDDDEENDEDEDEDAEEEVEWEDVSDGNDDDDDESGENDDGYESID